MFGIYKVSEYSKYQWKKLVKTKIRDLNKSIIVERTANQGYKKVDLDSLREDSFVKKSYFTAMNIHDARMRFKFSSRMLPTVKMNFQSDRKFMADLWTCSGCSQPGDANGYRDSQEHILVCEGYSRLREGKDLCSDDGLVKYFQEVISVRLSTL